MTAGTHGKHTSFGTTPLLSNTFFCGVCYLQEDYQAMADAAQKAIEIEEGNAMAHYLLGRAKQGMDDGIMSIAHLTKAIVLKDDFTEARLLRAEALIKMQQYKEATEDIDAILSQDPDEEAALLLRGKVKEAAGQQEEAETDYRYVTELNPFNEQAFLCLGQLYIVQKKYPEAIALFDEAIELNPNFAQAYHERGRAKLLNGDTAGSAEDMKKGLELNPKEIQGISGQYDNQPKRQTCVTKNHPVFKILVYRNISDIEILYILCIFLNEISSRLNLVTHKNCEGFVCLFCVAEINTEHKSCFGIHCCFPKLFGVHLTKTFVSLNFGFTLNLSQNLVTLKVRIRIFMLFAL